MPSAFLLQWWDSYTVVGQVGTGQFQLSSFIPLKDFTTKNAKRPNTIHIVSHPFSLLKLSVPISSLQSQPSDLLLTLNFSFYLLTPHLLPKTQLSPTLFLNSYLC